MAEKNGSCCLVMIGIETDKDELFQLKQSFQRFLHDMKLPFDIVRFVDTSKSPVIPSRKTESFRSPGNLAKNPQSLAVCLFLNETSDLTSAPQLRKHFLKSPWKLNHVIEMPENAKPRRIGRQEFYCLSSDLPLWSINTVHYGNEHVRFLINVRNLAAMRKFYETLTDREARTCGPDFCFLTISSEDGLDVQIGLKMSAEVLPIPSKTCRLLFRIPSDSRLCKYLETAINSTGDVLPYLLEDPDGNEVIVERSHAYVRANTVSMAEKKSDSIGLSRRLSSYDMKEADYSEMGSFRKWKNKPSRRFTIATYNRSDHGINTFRIPHRYKNYSLTFDGDDDDYDHDYDHGGDNNDENGNKDHIMFV